MAGIRKSRHPHKTARWGGGGTSVKATLNSMRAKVNRAMRGYKRHKKGK